MLRWQRFLTTPLDDDARREVARLTRAQRADAPPEARAGTVIEFRHGGGLECGFLSFTPTGRRSYTVVGLDGRQRHLRRDKVVEMAKQHVRVYPPDQALDELHEIDAQRQRISQQVDVDTLWQVVVDAGEDRVWQLGELLELHDRESLDPNRRAGLLRALWRGERFERDGDGWRPKSASRVEDMEAAAARSEAEAARRQQLAAWLRRVADGADPEPRPEGADAAIGVLEAAALGEDTPETAALMQAAHLHGAGAAFDVLVRLGRWSPRENLEVHRRGIPVEFGAQTLAAAGAVDAEAAQGEWPGRRRWGGSVYAVAGGERAYRLRRSLRGRGVVDIHMAVPALLVTPGGIVDTESAERGSVVRLLEGSLPLLPPAILEAAALTPAAARPALTLTVRLDDDLAPQEVQLSTCRVRPRGVIDAAASGETPPGPLRRLTALAAALRERRRQAGAWEGLQPSPWLEVRDGVPQRAASSPGQLIDDELQLLAAEALAVLLGRQGVAAIHTVREAPSPAAYQEVAARLAAAPSAGSSVDAAAIEAVRAFLLEGRAARATLTTTPGPHAGLGLPAAVVGAQPLSRYVDLVMQRQLFALAGVRSQRLDGVTLEQVLLDTQAAHEAARVAERRSQRDWSLVWLEGFGLDERLDGIVIEPRGAGHLVLMGEGPVSAYVPAAAGERLEALPGQRLKARVALASPRRDELRLADPELA